MKTRLLLTLVLMSLKSVTNNNSVFAMVGRWRVRFCRLEATEEEVLELGRLVRGTKASVGDRFRARIILHRLEGMSSRRLQERLDVVWELFVSGQSALMGAE